MANIDAETDSSQESGTSTETDSLQEHNNGKTQAPKWVAVDVVQGLYYGSWGRTAPRRAVFKRVIAAALSGSSGRGPRWRRWVV